MTVFEQNQNPNHPLYIRIDESVAAVFGESPEKVHHAHITDFYQSERAPSLITDHVHFHSLDPGPNEKAMLALEIVDCLCARGPLPRETGKKYLSSLLWKKDRELLAYFFDALQLELEHIHQLSTQGKISNEIAILQINNMLCYLAFTEPDCIDRPTIKVPVLKKYNRWSLETYDIHPIEITQKWMRFLASPYYAYGLSPKNKHNVPAQLLFMGTTYPAGRGSLWTYLFDLMPGLSVGTGLFWLGKKKIGQWISQQSRKVLCHGQSLGGSMSIFTAETFSEVTEAYAHVPAGQLLFRESSFEGKNITIYMQGSDPIAKMGRFSKSANYFYVAPNSDASSGPAYATTKGILGKLFSHSASLIGHPGAILLKVKPDWHIKQPTRVFWTSLLVAAGFFSICLLSVALILNSVRRILLSPFYGFYRKEAPKKVPAVFEMRREEAQNAQEESSAIEKEEPPLRWCPLSNLDEKRTGEMSLNSSSPPTNSGAS